MKKKRLWIPWTPESERRYTEHSILRTKPSCRPVLREFARWLEAERHLGLGSIELRVRSASLFLATITRSRPCIAGIRTMTARTIEDFFVRYGNTHGMDSRRSMQAAMRLFVRFSACHWWFPELRRGRYPSRGLVEWLDRIGGRLGYVKRNKPKQRRGAAHST